jgi:16S rRNA (cytidine1402-2'-O)-methyltransferase
MPIGNLGDVSERMRAALAEADLVACEDSRRTRVLLSALGLPAPAMVSVHADAERARVPVVLRALQAGQRVVLVVDAGLPGISDPGSRVVAAAAEAGFEVSVVPGPSAPAAALAVSGFDASRFVFEGFLARSGSKRSRALAALAAEERTSVLLESPRRLSATLADLAEACGEGRRCVVARELTKLHEEVWRGTLAEAVAWSAEGVRGEVVVVVEGARRLSRRRSPSSRDRAGPSSSSRSTRDLARVLAEQQGLDHRAAYQQALFLRRAGGAQPGGGPGSGGDGPEPSG